LDGALGRSWCILGFSLAILGHSLGALGALLGALGHSWDALGHSGVALSGFWAALGTTCKSIANIDIKNDRFGCQKGSPNDTKIQSKSEPTSMQKQNVKRPSIALDKGPPKHRKYSTT